MRKREIWLPDKIDDLGVAQARAQGVDASVYYAGLLADHLLSVQPPKPRVGAAEAPDHWFARHDGTLDSGAPTEREVEGRVRDPYDPDRPYAECDSGRFRYVGPRRGDHMMRERLHGSPFGIEAIFEKDPQGEWASISSFSQSLGQPFEVSESFPGFPDRSIEYAQRIVNEAIKIPSVIPSEYRQKSGRKVGIAFRPNFLMIEALLQRKSGVRVSLYGEPQMFDGRPRSLGRGRGRYSRIVVTSEDELEKLLPLIRRAYELKYERKGEPVPDPIDEA